MTAANAGMFSKRSLFCPLLAGFALLALLAGPPVIAQELNCQDGVNNDGNEGIDGADPDCQCLGDVADNPNCTANDVSFVIVGLGDLTNNCIQNPTDEVGIRLEAQLQTTAATRYDLGMWVALDGGDAYNADTETTGLCTRRQLSPVSSTSPTPTEPDGEGPFRDSDGDQCGEIAKDDGAAATAPDAIYQFQEEIFFPCQDLTGNGFVSLGTCYSYAQNSNTVCNNISELFPGTGPKCGCEIVETNIPAPSLDCNSSAANEDSAISCVETAGDGFPDDGLFSPGETIRCTVTYENDSTCTPVETDPPEEQCGTAAWVRFKISYDDSNGDVVSTSPVNSTVADDDAGTLTWTPDQPDLPVGIIGPGDTGSLTFDYTIDLDADNVTIAFDLDTFADPNDDAFDDEEEQLTSGGAEVVTCDNSFSTTPVTLAFFRAETGAFSTSLSWETATEAGNVGFNVYGRLADGRWERLNASVIPSHGGNAGVPESYRFEVEGRGYTAFRVEDLDLRGAKEIHGDFVPGRSYGERPEVETLDWARIRGHHADLQASRAGTRGLGRAVAAARGGNGGTSNASGGNGGAPGAVALTVGADGIYRVTSDELLAAGFDFSKTKSEDLVLRSAGEIVPMRVVGGRNFEPGSFLEFYGEALDTIYTADNVYLLSAEKRTGLRVGVDSTSPSGAPAGSYLERLTVERNRRYEELTPGPDPWVDTLIQAFGSTRSVSFPLDVDGLASSAGASVHVEIWGLSAFGTAEDHHVRILLNGTTVADRTFGGREGLSIDAPVPAGVLVEGANTVTVELVRDTGVPFDVLVVESYGVTYPRVPAARGGALALGGAAEAWSVSGVGSDGVVYRLGPDGAVYLAGAQFDGSGTVAFPGSAAAEYVVADTSALRTPAISAATTAGDLLAGEAEYLVIAHPAFAGSLGALLTARESHGLSTDVVTTDEIYAAYNHGVFDAEAIRSYIADAAASRGTEMVLLVGGDTYDYRDYSGAGSMSFVPSLYAPTGSLVEWAPVDAQYGDLDDDGVPDVPVGRFPVRTLEELGFLVDKTLAYEGKSYGGSAILSADSRNGFDFRGQSESFFSALDGTWSASRAYLDELDRTTARQRIADAVNGGTALTTFVGHSAPASWASGLFRASDAAALTNDGQPTVVIQWGCWNAYHVAPSYNTLGHRWLVSGSQGAAAVLGASTLVKVHSAERLSQHLAPLVAEPGMTLGEALVEAKRRVAGVAPQLEDVLLGWNLLGDPGLIVAP